MINICVCSESIIFLYYFYITKIMLKLKKILHLCRTFHVNERQVLPDIIIRMSLRAKGLILDVSA